MSDDPGWQRQIAENARRYAELEQRMARLSITEVSRDGVVHVTVSATGVLTDLVLNEYRQGTPLARIGAEIMACLRRAQARIPELMRQNILATVGPDDPAAAAILNQARQRFAPVPVQQAPQPQPVSAPRPVRRRTDDEGWDDGPILEDLDGGRR